MIKEILIRDYRCLDITIKTGITEKYVSHHGRWEGEAQKKKSDEPYEQSSTGRMKKTERKIEVMASADGLNTRAQRSRDGNC